MRCREQLACIVFLGKSIAANIVRRVWTDLATSSDGRRPRIGAELFCAADLRQALDAARQDGLDFACSPLSHPRNARDARGVSERRARRRRIRSDLALTCGEWSRLIVGTASAWPRLDARCAQQRRDGEAALTRELEWASHLSLAAVLLPPLPAAVYPVARRLRPFSESDVVAGVAALPPRVARGGGEAARGPEFNWRRRRPVAALGPRAAALRPLGGALRRARADGDAPVRGRGAALARRAAEVRARAVRLVSDERGGLSRAAEGAPGFARFTREARAAALLDWGPYTSTQSSRVVFAPPHCLEGAGHGRGGHRRAAVPAFFTSAAPAPGGQPRGQHLRDL